MMLKKKKFHMLIFWMVLNLFDALPHPRAGIFLLEATSVAVDSRDNVYVFNRGNMPVLVFDTHGQYNSHELMPVLVLTHTVSIIHMSLCLSWFLTHTVSMLHMSLCLSWFLTHAASVPLLPRMT